MQETNTHTYQRSLWILLGITALARLLVIGHIGLGDDEAHYFAYSLHPELSYFDHPPAIGYIIKFFTALFGVNEFAVRFPAVLLFFFTGYFLFLLAREMFDEKTAFYSVLLLNVVPVFSFLGGVLTVPDAPLALCWVVLMYLFWKMFHSKRELTGAEVSYDERHEHKLWYWYLIGVVLGLGLLSKYNMILLISSMLLYLAFQKKYRYVFKRPEPYLALLIAFVIFLPVVIWNMENGFASFGFQLKHGFGKTAPHFSLELLGRSLGAQAGYLSPLLFITYWVVLYRSAKQCITKKDDTMLFIFAFSVPTLFLFNAIASFNEILPHWPATGYLVLTIAVAKLTVDEWHKKRIKALTYISWGFAVILTVLIPVQALFKPLEAAWFMPKEEAAVIEDGVTKAEKVDVTNELYGWEEAGIAIHNLIGHLPVKPFIFTHRHYLSSQLSFYVPGQPRIYCLSERVDAYDFWQRDLSELQGKDALFVANSNFYSDPRGIYPYKYLSMLQTVQVLRKGRVVRKFWLYYLKNFDISALNPEYTAASLAPQTSWKQGLVTFDHALFWKINKGLENKLLNPIMALFSFFGNGAPLAALVGCILWVYRRESFKKEFLIGFLIVFIGSILVHILKDTVARVRPLTLWGDSVHVIGSKLYRTSFPSGHTQTSFGAAVFLATRFKKWWWAFFLFAMLVGISRVYVGVHFPIDVFVGAGIGLLSAIALLNIPAIKKRLD